MVQSTSPVLLIINPGSTSTKLAGYGGWTELFAVDVVHDWRALDALGAVAAQEDLRYDLVKQTLAEHAEECSRLAAVIGRGGLLRPLSGGVYRVSEKMLAELRAATYGEHASNLGAILAARVAADFGIPAFIADPVVVDELLPEARLSGMPELERKSIFHALNHKSVARRVAADLGRQVQDLNLIVAHLGGGISVAAHCRGRVIDVNNALDGDGPFSPERAGGVPSGQLARLVNSGQFTLAEIQRKLCGKGGVVAYLGTKDMAEVARRVAAGDSRAQLVFNALVHQVAKEIGAMATVLAGKVDAIVLTGGLAHLEPFTAALSQKVSFIAPIRIIPGEREMLALAENAMAALTGTSPILEY